MLYEVHVKCEGVAADMQVTIDGGTFDAHEFNWVAKGGDNKLSQITVQPDNFNFEVHGETNFGVKLFIEARKPNDSHVGVPVSLRPRWDGRGTISFTPVPHGSEVKFSGKDAASQDIILGRQPG